MRSSFSPHHFWSTVNLNLNMNVNLNVNRNFNFRIFCYVNKSLETSILTQKLRKWRHNHTEKYNVRLWPHFLNLVLQLQLQFYHIIFVISDQIISVNVIKKDQIKEKGKWNTPLSITFYTNLSIWLHISVIRFSFKISSFNDLFYFNYLPDEEKTN